LADVDLRFGGPLQALNHAPTGKWPLGRENGPADDCQNQNPCERRVQQLTLMPAPACSLRSVDEGPWHKDFLVRCSNEQLPSRTMAHRETLLLEHESNCCELSVLQSVVRQPQ